MPDLIICKIVLDIGIKIIIIVLINKDKNL
jgi:hypothetical protein